MSTSSTSTTKLIYRLAASGLLLLLFAQAMQGAVISSITFDEGPHLAIGYATLRTGDFRLQPVHIHPPLANVLAAAPLLLDPSLPDPRAIPGWNIASLSAVTDTVVWQYQAPGRLALAGRVPMILMAVLLGALVYRWAADLGGQKAGLLALFLYALDPNIVAHAQLITTDIGVTLFGLAAVYLYFRFQVSSRGRKKLLLVATGIALGAALATKVSAALLVPLLVTIVWLSEAGSLRQRALTAAAICLIAGGVVWAAYGFEIGHVPPIPFPIPAATHIKIYLSLQQHYGEGHPAFLMGENATHGWWYYFPLAFLVKTPLPTIILLLISLLVTRHSPALNAARRGLLVTRYWLLLIFPAVHFATALFSSVDIGYRHLLPALPFLFIFVGVQIANTLAPAVTSAGVKYQIANSKSRTAYFVFRNAQHTIYQSPKRSGVGRYTQYTNPRNAAEWDAIRITFYVLLFWCALSAALIFPHHLAYFNELAGGPDNGYQWLVDSNLDWGQNLGELQAWLDTHNISHVYLSHFSPARPEVYGIQASWLPPSPRAGDFAPFDPAPGWYAIGATTLQGVYTPDVNTYAWFRSREPQAQLGYALFIYKVEARPAPAWAAICASPTATLSPENARENWGQPTMRTILLDCTQSWIYAQDMPGSYVLPPGAESPPGTQLDLQARQANGDILYQVYRIESQSAVPGQELDGLPVWPISGKTMDGPLAPVGYWVNRAGAYPGETVELWTIWQVIQVPGRPLSLMAHMVGPDGIPIAVGDGLGVPIEQWQPGDTIVQRHMLSIPQGTPSNLYTIQTGAYWLDTIERWSIVDEQGTMSDHLELTTIGVIE